VKQRPTTQVDDIFLGYNGPHVEPTWRLRDVYGQIKKIVIVDDIPNLVATAYCDPGYKDFSGMVSKLVSDYSGIRRLDITWCMAGVDHGTRVESLPQPDAGGSRMSISSACEYQEQAITEDHEELRNVEELEDFDGLPSDAEISEISRVAQVTTVSCSEPLDSSSDQSALQRMHTQKNLQSRSDAPNPFRGSPSRSLANELSHGSGELDETSRMTQDTNVLSEGLSPNVAIHHPDLMNASLQALAGTSHHERHALESFPDSATGLIKDKSVVGNDVVEPCASCEPSNHDVIMQNETAHSSTSREDSQVPIPLDTPSRKHPTPIVSSSDARGTFESLQPAKWLTSTALNNILRLFHQPPYHILDPHYCDTKDPCRMRYKPLPCLPSPSQDGCKILAPVLHGDNHWTLLVLDLWSNTYDHFDSLGKAEYLDDAKQVVKEFLAGVKNRIREACEHNFPNDIEDRPNMWEGTVRPLVSLSSWPYRALLSSVDLPKTREHL
jgi:hypothetical protein